MFSSSRISTSVPWRLDHGGGGDPRVLDECVAHALQERVQLRAPALRIRFLELDGRDDAVEHGLQQAVAAGDVDVERTGARVQGGGDPAHRQRLQAL